MPGFRDDFIAEGLLSVGRPYVQHYVGNDPCLQDNGGNLTDPVCLERGLNWRGEGFDCMGLAIDAVRRTLGLPMGIWTPQLRHLEQFADLAVDRPGQEGDVAVFFHRTGSPNHMGILMGPNQIVHSTEHGRAVRIGTYTTEAVRFIDPEELTEIAAGLVQSTPGE